MTREEIKTIVIEKLLDVGDWHLGEIKETDRLKDDLGLDSLDAVELILAFESAFDIAIPDDETEEFANMTVGQTIDYLLLKIK